ncbi:N-6 DNA methylase [Methanobrevibacter sp.]|uniref:N-6 DNA methylase n=1 Tax=Methanobrevibacter sp. TaxID=66852 RepID=UPI003890CD64
MRKLRNYKILRDIRSKTRQFEITSDMSYLIIYAFLYKYCSDLLKDYFTDLIADKEMTLDEAFADEDVKQDFKRDAYNMFGYFITGPDFFIDEIMNAKYSGRFFIFEFVRAFTAHTELAEGSNYERYFRFIFDAVKSEVNLNKFEFEGENHLIVKEIIYSISKLDIYEEEFTFQDVFDALCDMKLIRIDQDPDYLNLMMAALVNSTRNDFRNIYNPCLNDASSLISVVGNHTLGLRAYGRCQDKLSYCFCIVKLFINFFDLDGITIDYASPFEAPNQGREIFDVIISKIPPITSRTIKRLNKTQNAELAKRNKEIQLQDMLSSTLNIDETSFAEDEELKNTLKTLIDKMEIKDEQNIHFSEEYMDLNDSEYLFLIHLLDSLNDYGVMVLSMAQSFLFKNSLTKLRKFLTYEKNCIDAVIAIPDELSRPKKSDVLVVFNKSKRSDDIVFIDMTNDFDLKPSRKAIPGMFKRNLVLDDKTLFKVVDVYKKRQHVDRFSNAVSMDEIRKNNFNLSISRYVDTFEGEFVKFEDLKNEKKEITSRIKELNQKIDMMMDDLGLRF